MPNNTRLYKNSRLIFIIAYFIIGFVSIPFFRYELSPDSISYFSIAEKYASFDFANAINAYWSPLVSWLLVPFIWLKIPILIAARILMILIGFGIIHFAERLVRAYSKKYEIYFGAMICIAFTTLTFSSIFFSADTLFLLLLLAFIYYTNTWESTWRNAFRIGITGTLLYYSKAYGLPFFLLCFTALFILKIILTEKKRIKIYSKTYIKSLAVFFVGAGIWVTLLSLSYGYFTTGTAAKYNHNLVGPESKGHPFHYIGLMPPPNETATSFWEDINPETLPDWSAFSSKKEFIHQLSLIKGNIIHLQVFLKHFSILSSIIIFLSLIILLQQKRKLYEHELFRLFLIGGTLVSGYLLILVEFRYVYLLGYILIFASVFIIEWFWAHFHPNTFVKIIIGLVFISLFIKGRVVDISKYYLADKDNYNTAQVIKKFQIDGNIASVNMLHESMNICYLNKLTYFGNIGPLDINTANKQLEEFEIDYIFVWEPFPDELNYNNFTLFGDTINRELLVLKRE